MTAIEEKIINSVLQGLTNFMPSSGSSSQVNSLLEEGS